MNWLDEIEQHATGDLSEYTIGKHARERSLELLRLIGVLRAVESDLERIRRRAIADKAGPSGTVYGSPEERLEYIGDTAEGSLAFILRGGDEQTAEKTK